MPRTKADAGPKRPAGAVTRPKDGVQHPDLDKASAEYEADVARAREVILAAMNKKLDAAHKVGGLAGFEGDLPPERG